MTKITKRIVDAAKPDPARRFTVWDAEIKGFGLLVLPSGIKSYILDYRTPEGRKRRATIGKHGTYTAEEARARADAWRRIVRDGGDPLEHKAAARNALTVDGLLDRYLASGRFAEKADSTRAIDRGRIARHLRPLIGRRYVDKLTAEDVRRAFAATRDGKTAAVVKTTQRGVACVKGGEGTARMAVRLLRAIFAWAVTDARLAASNPAAMVNVGADGGRDTILADADQYTALFATLDRMEGERRIRQPVADAVRVIALTGARRGEVAGLRWRHVDLKAGRIVIPPSGHKAGRATGKPRVIDLPALAQAIVARQPGGDADDLVFAPARGEGPINLSKPWRTIRAEAGLPEGIGLHGLRHSLASHMAMAGAQAAEIMTALGHRQISTSQRYVHFAEDARRALAERAAAVAIAGMTAAVGAKERQSDG